MEGRGWEILWQLRELRAESVRDNFKIDGGMRESQVTDEGPVSRVKADPTQCFSFN